MKKNVNPITVWFLIGIIFIVIVFTAFNQIRKYSSNNPISDLSSNNQKEREEAAEIKDATIIFDYGNGKVRKFKGPIDGESKVWDAIQQAAAVGEIDVEVSNDFVLQGIGGFKNGTNGRNWSLYLNKKKQNLTLANVDVKPGDEILFRFE